jgi:hypothetical protein
LVGGDTPDRVGTRHYASTIDRFLDDDLQRVGIRFLLEDGDADAAAVNAHVPTS